MNKHEQIQPQPSDTPAPWPFWLVGLAIFSLLVVILVAGLLLSRRFQPPVDVATVAAGAMQSTPTPTQPAAPTATLVPLFPTIPLTPTVVNTPTEVQAAGTPTQPVPAATAPTETPQPAPPVIEPGTTGDITVLEQEIKAAYLHYWDVRAAAYLNLDTSHLAEVMAGAELARETKQIEDLKAQNKPSKMDIEHHISFALIADDHATIYDPYVNKSVWIDPITKQPLARNTPPTIEKVSFILRKIDGTWKVVDGAILP